MRTPVQGATLPLWRPGSRCLFLGGRGCKFVKTVRGHILMTSTKFGTPSVPLVRISPNLSLLFVRKIGQFLNPLPPPCGRHMYMVPYRVNLHNGRRVGECSSQIGEKVLITPIVRETDTPSDLFCKSSHCPSPHQ